MAIRPLRNPLIGSPMLPTPSFLRQRGFTLTEAAIVLGIVGALLSAVWLAATSVYVSGRVAHSSEQLTTIIGRMRSLYGMRPTIDVAATSAELAASGVFPFDMPLDVATGNVGNLWGGNAIIAAANVSGIMGDGFSVTFTQVPRDACVQLLMRWAGNSLRDAGLVGADSAVTTATAFPVALTDATTSCAAATNDVVLTLRLRP